MFMNTTDLAELLKRERPELLAYQHWLASLLARAWEAGDEHGRAQGQREAFVAGLTISDARSSVSGNTAE